MLLFALVASANDQIGFYTVNCEENPKKVIEDIFTGTNQTSLYIHHKALSLNELELFAKGRTIKRIIKILSYDFLYKDDRIKIMLRKNEIMRFQRKKGYLIIHKKDGCLFYVLKYEHHRFFISKIK